MRFGGSPQRRSTKSMTPLQITLVGAIVGAALGAILGAAWTWLLGQGDREKATKLAAAQCRIAELEEEMSRRDAVDRFSPLAAVLDEPPRQQSLRLSSDIPFAVSRLDYLSGDGVKAATQEVEKSGIEVVIPLEVNNIVTVHRLSNRSSFALGLRVHLAIDGKTKSEVVPTNVTMVFVNEAGGSTGYWKVIG